MDNLLLDLAGWKRSFAPAFRAFVYMTILYLLIFIVLAIPNYMLLALGVDLQQLFSMLSVIGLVLAFFLAFFKVLDEVRPGDIPLEMV